MDNLVDDGKQVDTVMEESIKDTKPKDIKENPLPVLSDAKCAHISLNDSKEGPHQVPSDENGDDISDDNKKDTVPIPSDEKCSDISLNENQENSHSIPSNENGDSISNDNTEDTVPIPSDDQCSNISSNENSLPTPSDENGDGISNDGKEEPFPIPAHEKGLDISLNDTKDVDVKILEQDLPASSDIPSNGKCADILSNDSKEDTLQLSPKEKSSDLSSNDVNEDLVEKTDDSCDQTLVTDNAEKTQQSPSSQETKDSGEPQSPEIDVPNDAGSQDEHLASIEDTDTSMEELRAEEVVLEKKSSAEIRERMQVETDTSADESQRDNDPETCEGPASQTHEDKPLDSIASPNPESTQNKSPSVETESVGSLLLEDKPEKALIDESTPVNTSQSLSTEQEKPPCPLNTQETMDVEQTEESPPDIEKHPDAKTSPVQSPNQESTEPSASESGKNLSGESPPPVAPSSQDTDEPMDVDAVSDDIETKIKKEPVEEESAQENSFNVADIKQENMDDTGDDHSDPLGSVKTVKMELLVDPSNFQEKDEKPGKKSSKRKSDGNEGPKPKKQKGSPMSTKRCRSTVVDLPPDETIPEGWKRLVVQRQGGASAGKHDVYYFSPAGKKLRSRNEVASYCQKNGIDIDVKLFHFSHHDPTKPPVVKTPKVKTPKPPRTLKTPKTPKPPRTLKTPKTPKTPASSTAISPSKIKKEPIEASEKPKKEASEKPKKEPAEKCKKSAKSSHFKVNSRTLMKPTRPRVKINGWSPPVSPFKLFQESLYHNPWQLLIGTILLNRTNGEEVVGKNTLYEFLERWPSPQAVIEADSRDIVEVIKPLGLSERRAKTITQFSKEYMEKNWTYPKELHGIGKYGNDSYRIFCMNEWSKVKPTDFLLIYYVSWLSDNYKVLNIEL